MKSPAVQQCLPFDVATLTLCINALKPKPVQSLFRGLLMMAAQIPQSVVDIDDDGWVLMNASFPSLAPWAGVTERTLQRCRDRAESLQYVQHSAGVNSSSEWLFRLTSVLPASSVDWFREAVSSGSMATQKPDHSSSAPRQNVTLTKPECHPDKTKMSPRQNDKCHPKCQGDIFNPSLYGFSIKTQLAMLAAELKDFGFQVSGQSWDSLTIDSAAFGHPGSIDAIWRAVTASGMVESTPVNRRRFFIMAAVAHTTRHVQSKWGWVRKSITEGWWLTRPETDTQRAMAETWLRVIDGCDAADLMPEITGEQAWAKVKQAIRLYSPLHELDAIRGFLGSELYAAVKTVGLRKIADSDPKYEHGLRKALSDAWQDHLQAKQITSQ